MDKIRSHSNYRKIIFFKNYNIVRFRKIIKIFKILRKNKKNIFNLVKKKFSKFKKNFILIKMTTKLLKLHKNFLKNVSISKKISNGNKILSEFIFKYLERFENTNSIKCNYDPNLIRLSEYQEKKSTKTEYEIKNKKLFSYFFEFKNHEKIKLPIYNLIFLKKLICLILKIKDISKISLKFFLIICAFRKFFYKLKKKINNII
jgi:hypothetical protein